MSDIELRLPDGDVDAEFEAFALLQGLQLHRGALLKYPGSIHWHLTRPNSTGTIEATWWPAKGRLWLSIRRNRAAAWQGEVVEDFVARFGTRASASP